MHAYRLAVRLLVFRFATGRRTGDDLDIGVAQIANGMHQRPHGNGFPIAGRVVVEQYELPDHIIRQRAVGRLVNHAPGHGIWCKQFIDERNNMLLVDIRAEHILAEFLQQLRAHGLMRNNKMQIREELLQHLGIVANRIHNVIPASGIHIPCRRGKRSHHLRLEHIGCGQRHAAHVHHVENTVRTGQIVGGHNDQRDLIDQIRGEAMTVIVIEFGEFVEHLTCIGRNIVLGARLEVALPKIEQSLQVSFLHIAAEEFGVAVAELKTWLGGDAAQFIARLQNQLVKLLKQYRVGFQLAKHRDDDR